MRDFHLPGRSVVHAASGMCATSHPLAAKVAVQMLEAGGNAVDAAIAGAVLLGLCEPQMTGLGGDCFALLAPPGSAAIIGLNGSGRAPAGLDAADLRGRGLAAIPLRGVEAVTLPGAVDAFCRLAQDWGRLGLAAALAPAIRYADQGVPVAPRVAWDWDAAADTLKGRARDFYLTGGRAPAAGTLFRAPAQAEVLRRIAAQGRAGFYEGEVAADLLASLRAAGGCHAPADFAATACDWTTPVSTAYGGMDLHEHPPNGQGATALLILNILSHFDLAKLDPLGAARAHLETEACKLAYAARDRFIADTDDLTGLHHMLSPATAGRLAGLIDPTRALPANPPGADAIHRDTVTITVVDRDRMAVSLICSTFWAFGTGIASDRFGILFQNRGAGFTLTPGHPNEGGGGKRPLHTIIPGMLTQQGRVLAPFGVMGGAYQPTGHARFVSNIADYGMDVQAAIDAPRCFAEHGGVSVERGYAPGVIQGLADLGHTVTLRPEPLGGAQAIFIGADGMLSGGSDPRKDGCALGY